MQCMMELAKIEEKFEWRKWMDKIPFLKIPEGWEVRAIPPFAGAVVRYQFKKGEKKISVYLDCYEQLGFFGEPYWEAYPIEGDTFRCAMHETDRLLQYIGEEFNREGGGL